MLDKADHPLTVTVDFDRTAGIYRYRYSSPEANSPAISLMFSDLAPDAKIIASGSWRSCQGSDGTAICLGRDRAAAGRGEALVFQSRRPPAIVRYSLVSPFTGNDAYKANVATVGERTPDESARVKNIIDNAMEARCPFGQAGRDFNRGTTGVILGPSDRVSVQVREVKQSARGYEVMLAGSGHQELARSPARSFVLRDSSGKSLTLVEAPAAVRTAQPQYDLLVTISRPDACNSHGVLVDFSGDDGTLYRTGFPISPPSCNSRVREIMVTIPDASAD